MQHGAASALAVPPLPHILPQVLEYDFVTDVWYCHPQLPRASFGGGHSYIPDRQQVVIVGGGDSYRVAATDDVLIVRLDQLTRFEACMVSERLAGWYLVYIPSFISISVDFGSIRLT